jgi:type II secretory pathway component PulF
MNPLKHFLTKLRFDERVRLEVYEQLKAAAVDGISLKDAITNLYDINSRAGRQTLLRHVFSDWLDGIGSGQPFHEAVGEWVPEHERMVLASADRGQSLIDALDALETQVKTGNELRQTIYKAAAWPVIYLLMIMGILWIVATRLLPELLKTTERETALDAAWLFVRISEVIAAMPWLPPLLAALLMYGIKLIMPLEFPLRKKLDAIFPFSFYRLLQGSSFLMTLAGLLKVGTSQVQALEIINERGSPWMRARVQPIIDGMSAGQKLGHSADQTGYAFPTQKIVDNILFYEGTSQSSIAVERAAARWIKDGKRSAEIIGATLQTLGLLTVALIVMWVVFNVGLIVSLSSFIGA